jgi:hypothetical protein
MKKINLLNPFEPMEQIEDEYGPTLPYVFDDVYDPMDAMEEAHNDRPCFMDELEGDIGMIKCTLCNWENVESNESLVDYLNRNGIMNIDLCNFHEYELKAFCEED